MSMYSRTLDRAGRLADELVVDALFIVRRKRWHWPAVAAGLVGGFGAGLAVTGQPGIISIFLALIGGGLGMNAGSDFRFIARTPTRVLLYESSRVVGVPTQLVGALDPVSVTCSPSGPAMHLIIGDETHVMARQHEERLRRMLAIAPVHLQGATEGTT